jgi:OOP family OmpA-OmpF porin
VDAHVQERATLDALSARPLRSASKFFLQEDLSMKSPRTALAIVGTAAALCVLPAAAQQRPAPPSAESWGTYAGGSIGDSDYDVGFKIFVGQQFHPNLAFEGQLTRFGERDERRFGAFAQASAWAVGGSLVGLFPLNQDVSVFGKLGMHYVKTKVKGPGFSVSDSDVDLGIGAGARYRINQQLSLRAELEDIGDGGDMISVGVQLRF